LHRPKVAIGTRNSYDSVCQGTGQKHSHPNKEPENASQLLCDTVLSGHVFEASNWNQEFVTSAKALQTKFLFPTVAPSAFLAKRPR
jgi:hypothetical protein